MPWDFFTETEEYDVRTPEQKKLDAEVNSIAAQLAVILAVALLAAAGFVASLQVPE
jgi:hypothetical protein